MNSKYEATLSQLLQIDPDVLRARLKELEIERKIILSVLEKYAEPSVGRSSSHASPVEMNDYSQEDDILGETTLTEADLSYNCLRFSIRSQIAKTLPHDGKVKVSYKDKSIEGTIPPSVRGRINGVHLYKKFPNEFKVGSKLFVKYSDIDREIVILNVN